VTVTVLGYPGARGRRADGEIVEGIVPQFDGSTFGAFNCGACGEAHRIVAQQFGRRPSKGSPWYPTGKSIRTETGDKSGGLMPSQTTTASLREYGTTYAIPRIAPWADVEEALWEGRTVDLLLSYGPVDDFLSGSPGFRGNHRSPISGIRRTSTGQIQGLWADSLYCGRRSGIPRGPRWVPMSVLKRAAGLLVLDARTGETLNQARGSGKAYFIPTLTRYMPAPLPIPTPAIVEDAPTPKERNRMIASASVVTTRVMRLAEGQPLYRYPGGPRVTRMARTGDVGYVGHAGGSPGWGLVIAVTNNVYADGKSRPTGLYVPIEAGPIRAR
jgi:hypothetical protein